MTDTHDFAKNVQFQHGYIMQAQYLISQYARYFIRFRLADAIEDTKQSTDAVIELENKATIALRIRRYKEYGAGGKVYRDLTLRAQSKGGGQTELHKIRAGWCDWYFYAWLDKQNAMTEYMLIDVNRMRAAGIMAKDRRVIPNGDGTGFVSYTIKELHDSQSLIVCKVCLDGYWRQWERIERAELLTLPAHLADAA